MKKLILLLTLLTFSLNAHFLALLPSTDNITKKDKSFELQAMFIHPFEQSGMTMSKPSGVYVNNLNSPLVSNENIMFDKKAWIIKHKVNKPGLYKYFLFPEPYFEKSEQKFISHVPKVIVSAYGREDTWDEPIGLKYEIIPMTKPFALYSGNQFTAMVLVNGKAASNIDVEVELYNEYGLKAPSDAHITQVVKTNVNGIFSFVMNHKGWWGFAALIEEGTKEYKGKEYPIENGALLWIKAY